MRSPEAVLCGHALSAQGTTLSLKVFNMPPEPDSASPLKPGKAGDDLDAKAKAATDSLKPAHRCGCRLSERLPTTRTSKHRVQGADVCFTQRAQLCALGHRELGSPRRRLRRAQVRCLCSICWREVGTQIWERIFVTPWCLYHVVVFIV